LAIPSAPLYGLSTLLSYAPSYVRGIPPSAKARCFILVALSRRHKNDNPSTGIEASSAVTVPRLTYPQRNNSHRALLSGSRCQLRALDFTIVHRATTYCLISYGRQLGVQRVAMNDQQRCHYRSSSLEQHSGPFKPATPSISDSRPHFRGRTSRRLCISLTARLTSTHQFCVMEFQRPNATTESE
jgi:hypothetical protein